MIHVALLRTLDILIHQKNDSLPKNYKKVLLEAQAEAFVYLSTQEALQNDSLQKTYQQNRAAGIRIRTIVEELQKRLSDFSPTIVGLHQLRPYIKLPSWIPIIISSDTAHIEVQQTLEHHGFRSCTRKNSLHGVFPEYGSHLQRNAFSVSLLQETCFVKSHHFEAAGTDHAKELLLLLDILLTLWLQQGWSQTWYSALMSSSMMQPQTSDVINSMNIDDTFLKRLIEDLGQHSALRINPDSLFQKISQHSSSSIKKLSFLYQQGSLTIDLIYQILRRVS